MWYTGFIITYASHNCSQCNSPLLLISRETEKLEGSLFAQTISTYRCTNQACQEEKDKQTEKRIELAREKEVATAIRTEKRLQAKLLEKSAKMDTA